MKKLLNLYFKIVLLILFGSFFYSCNDSETNPTPAADRSISSDIKSLVHIYGKENADIVIVNTQGGPLPELLTTEFEMVLKPLKLTSDYLAVNVHQYQTQNKEIFAKNEITFEKAQEYDAETVETLYKVVKYFKDQKRTVFVLGISFGAFVTQELISKKGYDVADKFLIMVGRLDINEEFWKKFSEGKTGRFIDGVTPEYEEVDDVIDKNMFKLAAGLGKNRYTQTLAKYNNLSNVIYVYGKKDEAVGRLTDEEVNFLKSKNVTIYVSENGHGGAVDEYIKKGINEGFGLK